jgi:hypothetical protein
MDKKSIIKNFFINDIFSKIFIIFSLLFCAAIGFVWLKTTPSFEEMYGGTARSGEFFNALKSVRSWPWWTPNYLFGHSCALYGVSLFQISVLVGSAFLLSGWMTPIFVFKIIGLLIMCFAGLTMFYLARKIFESNKIAFLAGILYLTSAQLVMRIAMLEHLSTGACMVLGPLVYLALLRCEEIKSLRNSMLLAIAVSGMLFCYFKIFILFLPAAGIFILWRFFSINGESKRNLIYCVKWAFLLTIPLALFPLIPVYRESKFLALFELEPFQGWQQNFSFFSAITWIDWGNFLTYGTAIPSLQGIRHTSIEFYLGPVVLAGILIPLAMGHFRKDWGIVPAWGALRCFTISLIMATWLASGPRSIVESHFTYLSASMGCSDFTIAILWLVFIAQGLLIYLVSGKTPIQIGLGILFIGIYYLVPGFKVLELIPIYRDIRAPSSVWTSFGTLSAVLASGAGWSLLARIEINKWKKGLAVILIIAALLIDVCFLHEAFFIQGLPKKTFTDYAEAQLFLKNAQIEGRVHALSGRYFYLTTPLESGRGLSSEALGRHFQLRWIRYMESGSMLSPETSKAYFDLFGISYVLIDRKDPDTPPTYQAGFKQLFPTVFENDGFTILENSSSLYPAYEAKNIVSAEKEIFKNPSVVLLLGRGGLIAVEGFQGNNVGKIDLQGRQDIPDRVTLEKTSSLKKLALQEPRNKNYHSFTVTGLETEETPRAIVVSEAYHPDWKAYQGNESLPVYRAVGALLAVEVSQPDDVHFVFTPPWYYSFCATACLLAWICAVLLFLVMRLPFIPEGFRSAWYGKTNE